MTLVSRRLVSGEVLAGTKIPEGEETTHTPSHTPSIAFRHLPPDSARFSYAIGSRKLSANEQFFVVVGAQTVESLLQTTQIKQGVSFIVANKVYTSTNKTTIV